MDTFIGESFSGANITLTALSHAAAADIRPDDIRAALTAPESVVWSDSYQAWLAKAGACGVYVRQDEDGRWACIDIVPRRSAATLASERAQ